MAGLISWLGVVPNQQQQVTNVHFAANNTSAGGLPSFVGDMLGDAYSVREFSPPSINLSYSQPGVRFVGIYGAYSKWYSPSFYAAVTKYHQGSWPRDLSTGRTFQPFAVITPWENGTLPQLPPGFGGPRLVTKPIPGDWRLALLSDRITVFSGGTVFVRAVNTDDRPQSAPQVVELDVPRGLRIVMHEHRSVCCAGYRNVTDVSNVAGGGAVPAGYWRLRLNKEADFEWGYLNEAIELKLEVDADLAGNVFTLTRIRAYTGAANQRRADNWQTLAITVKTLVPVPRLPRRLRTSFCYTTPRQFVDDPAKLLSSLTTWKALGFNTIPNAGGSDATPPGSLPGSGKGRPGFVISAANRTGVEWAGLKYGVVITPFTSAGLSAPPYSIGTFDALVKPVSAADSSVGPDGFNFSAHGLSLMEEKTERTKWRNALVFYSTHKMMDISYDGYFRQHDYQAIGQLVNYTKPDFLTMDIESLPQLEAWIRVGYKSSNFAGAKRAGERDSTAALRIASSWIGGIVTAAMAAHPAVKVQAYNVWAEYDHGHQLTSWPMVEQMGLAADEPSFYERPVQNDLAALASEVRAERLAIGTSVDLIPWLTPGQTYGTDGPHSQDPGRNMYNVLIQSFCSGATGFNVFQSRGMNDMAIWFAFRDAIALVTPYEDLIVEGVPAPTELFSKVASTAVFSAMMYAPDSVVSKAILIASSTLPLGQPTAFTLTWAAANASSWKLCNLATNVSTPVSASGVTTYTSVAEHGSVLLLSASTPCETDDATTASVDADSQTTPVCDLPLDTAAGLTACIHEATAAIVSISFDGWTQRLNASTQLFDGCHTSEAPTVLRSSSTAAGLTLTRRIECSPSKYHTDSGLVATVTDTWRVIALPVPAIEWNTSVESASGRYWTTELNDILELPPSGTAIWTAASDGSRLESDHTSLDPLSLAEYRGRTYYGRDMWSSNGRGTVMLCSPAGGAACHGRAAEERLATSTPPAPPRAAPGWFEGQNSVACGYPECCGDPTGTPGCHKPSKYPLLLLGNASTGVKTAADCEKLCLDKLGCEVWQIGSPTRGSTCQSVEGMTTWTPLASSSGRVAGCKLSAVSGCGKTPPSPSPPDPRPSPSPPSNRGKARTTSLPIISLLFGAADGPFEGPFHGISLVQSLDNFPNNAYLDADGSGALNWTRQWFRFGNGTAPIQLRRHLVPHEDDWRPGLGFLVENQAAAFTVHPDVNRSLIDGAGSFADYRGEQDKRPFSTELGADGYGEKLRKMNYQVNWMTTANNGESHGTWMPFNLSTGGLFTDGWTSCMGIPNFTAYFTAANSGGQLRDKGAYQYPTPCTHQTYSSLGSWFSDLASFGFSTMLYGNYWEYGWSCDGGRGNRATSNNDCDTGFGMPAGIKTSTPLPFCDPLPHCDPREAGFPHTDPEAPAQRACKLRLLCDTNLYMRKHLMGSVLRPWSGANGHQDEANMSDSVIKTGMEGSIIQDIGMPEYQAYQVKMVNLAMEQFPQTAGVAFDGTGWQGRINLNADDGRSYVELHESGETGGPFVRLGKPIHTQVSSMRSAQEAIGNALHAKGKAHFWNPYAPRADFMMHTDGVFSEDSYMDERMHLHALLGVGGKPILTWNPGCESWPSSQCGRYKDSANNEQLLQRLLYWGVQPMVPFARNDHAITRFVAEHGNDTQTFIDYGPLFRALRGRRWVYTAHAVVFLNRSSASAAAINIFSRVSDTTEELVLTISLAAPGTKLAIRVRGVANTATTASLQLLVPGGNTGSNGTNVTLQPQDTGTNRLDITIGSRPAAVVILPAQPVLPRLKTDDELTTTDTQAAVVPTLMPTSASHPLKLAAAQVLVNDGDYPGNLHRISTAVAKAAAGGAELVAFPETSLDGWMLNSAVKVAPPIPGNWSETIGRLAAQHSIWVLVGIVETDDDLLYDTAILMNSTGRLVMKHRKNNIVCLSAGCNYAAGHGVSVAATPWGRLGILICADTFNHSVVAAMAALKPDVLIVPFGFQAPPESNVENQKQLAGWVSKTAIAVGAPTVGINNVGAVGGNTGVPGHASMGVANTYCGASNWADPTGRTMAAAADRDVDLAFWTVPTNKKEVEAMLKTDDDDDADDDDGDNEVSLAGAVSASMALVTRDTSQTSFDVMAFGARGTGKDDDTPAILQALSHAAAVGGPVVVFFPAEKTFLTKPFNFSINHLTLEINGTIKWVTGSNSGWGLDYVRGTPCSLDRGKDSAGGWKCPTSDALDSARCQGGYKCVNQSLHPGSPECQRYCHPAHNASVWPLVPDYPSWNTAPKAGQAPPPPSLRYQSLMMATNVHDITVRGSGSIDGQGMWWWGLSNQTISHNPNPYGRPRLIEFYNCTRVEMSGITVMNSPFWTVNFYNSSIVHAHHLTIRNLRKAPQPMWGAPNADGMDCNSCKDSIIEHNDISVGDDHIAVKSGLTVGLNGTARDEHPRYEARNVTIRHNKLRTGMGLVIGSETSGGIKDIYIHDNELGLCDACMGLDGDETTCPQPCGWNAGLHLKTTTCRGGVIENVRYENNLVHKNYSCISLITDYQMTQNALDRCSPTTGYPATTIRNISWIGNTCGSGGGSWGCSVNDTCSGIAVVNNSLPNGTDYQCEYIESFTVHGNEPLGLPSCMRESMHPPLLLPRKTDDDDNDTNDDDDGATAPDTDSLRVPQPDFMLTDDAPRGLQVNFLTEPLGVDRLSAGVLFSWQLPADRGGGRQSGAQIIVNETSPSGASTATVFDSGALPIDNPQYVATMGAGTLHSDSTYIWAVRTRKTVAGGWSSYSTLARFSTGLLVRSDWTAT